MQSSDIQKVVKSLTKDEKIICECGTVGLCPVCGLCDDVCCQC